MQTLPAVERPTCHAAALPCGWAERIIERMQALYGTQFARQWESVEPKRLAEIWGEELAGFTGVEIAAGLTACKTRPWPPTLPEFVTLCRPWLDPEIAFRQAVTGMTERRNGKPGTWPHPALYWAAVYVGTHDLLACNWQTMRNRWETTLRDVLAENQWQPIPEPTRQLNAPTTSAMSRNEAEKFATQVKQITGKTAMPTENVKDHKAWARRILDNPKGRSIAVVKMAQQALGIENKAIPA